MTSNNDRHGKNPMPPDDVVAPQPGETSTPPRHEYDGPSADARSGTGQRTPHHGLGDADAEELDQTADADTEPALATGTSYQSGGTRRDRAQQEEERKQRDGGAGVAHSPQGGADPAPGAPATRDGF
jgi:hypothetical protein